MSGQSPDPITLRLARLLARPVSPADRMRAALHVLDWTGCSLAGAVSEPGRAMRTALHDEAEGQCTALVGGRGLSPLGAALANGALGNVLEMDDVDKRAILHPGPGVIPAALALAEARECESARFLDAIVRGYEAVIRLGRAVGPGHYAYWHNTGTCGPLGAAAAAASILGLDETASAHALALAATQASGFWQTRHEPGSMAKQLHTARAAHAGLLAGQLAARGFKGPLTVLEGAQGFFAATCPDGDPGAVLTEPEAGWRIHEVSFKPWPACRHAHPAIDAALALRDYDPDPGRIREVEIVTYADAVKFCDRPRPQSVIEAKFSLQHALAVTLLRGAPRLEDFEPAAFEDTRVRGLAEKIQVRAGEPYDGAYPAHYGALVRIDQAEGPELSERVSDALGDPENPLSQDRLVVKARALGAWAGIEEAGLNRLIDQSLALPRGDRLESYTGALRQLEGKRS